MVGRTFVILILALVLPAVGGDVPVLGMPGDPSPVVVRSVRIEGASVIASDDLKGGMSIRKGRTFLQQMVEGDVRGILERYRKVGYWQAAVVPSVKVSDGRVRVLFRIEEGRPTRLDSVTFGGNGRVPKRALQAQMWTAPGGVLLERRVAEDLNRILGTYESLGYPFCSLTPTLEVLPGLDSAHLDIQVGEGPYVQIDSVRFEGNRVTRDDLLRRELRFAPGDAYDRRQVRRGLASLQRLPFLDSAEEVALEPLGSRQADPMSAVLVVRVKEHRSARLEGGLGVARRETGGATLLTGRVGLQFDNLSGRGRLMSFLWRRRSERSADLNLAVREPWVAGAPLRLGAVVAMRQRPGFRETQLGVDLEWMKSPESQVGMGVRMTAVTDESLAVSAGSLSGLRLSDRVWGLEAFARRDTRDHDLNPRRGRYLEGRVSWGKARTAGAWVDRAGFDVTADHFFAVSDRWVAALQLRGAGVFQDRGVPDEALLRLGGALTLRGQREEAFLAEQAGWARLEWRRMLGDGSRTFVFVDGGAVRERTGEGVRWAAPIGYGFGIRSMSKIGQIGLDYGLGRGDTPGEGKVHVRVEGEF